MADDDEYFDFGQWSEPKPPPPASDAPKVAVASTDAATVALRERLMALMSKPRHYTAEEMTAVRKTVKPTFDALVMLMAEDAIAISREQAAAEKTWRHDLEKTLRAQKKFLTGREQPPQDKEPDANALLLEAHERLRDSIPAALDQAGITGDLKREEITRDVLAGARDAAKGAINDMMDFAETGIHGNPDAPGVRGERGAEWYSVAKLDFERAEEALRKRGLQLSSHQR